MKKHYKLGTRKSLLAQAQSRWVADEIQKRNPEITIELVGIETQGDIIVDIPLREAPGRDFFVKELDQALIAERVDFSVHSMKDLSLDRPSEIVLAAVPEREAPHDVLVCQPKVLQVLEFEKRPLRIGTSAPRRLANLPAFLKKALPRLRAEPIEIEWVEIRGNVNTRLSRVQLPIGDAKFLDGVVLAAAGLTRLQRDLAGSKELAQLMLGTRLMVLPIKDCPTAPAQGALAIECRSNDMPLREILQSLHHEPTLQSVLEEREILKAWGGGCHQKLGATSIFQPRLQNQLFISGVRPDGKRVQEYRWNAPERPAQKMSAWDGSLVRQTQGETPIGVSQLRWSSGRPPAVFVAHSRAVTDEVLKAKLVFRSDRIWTSGSASWFRLAEKGIWVEGCAEELGWDHFINFQKKLSWLLLSEPHSWAVLTHANTGDVWSKTGIREFKATYQVSSKSEPPVEVNPKADFYWWSSASQFEKYSHLASKDAHFACGAGRTADVIESRLGSADKRWAVFPSVVEWRKWVKNV